MKKINKDTPPIEFTDYIKKNNPLKWEQLNYKMRIFMKEYMLIYEQDCLCGYSEIPLEEAPSSSHIDHYFKRDYDNKKTFDWNNMIVSTVDEDFGGKFKDNTYKIKKEEYLQIFNPVVEDMSKYIEYSGDGSIVAKKNTDKIIIDKVNKTIEVFNLNNTSLKNRRKLLLNELRSLKDYLNKEDLIKNVQSRGFISLIKWYINTY